jgi:hypothetical protein
MKKTSGIICLFLTSFITIYAQVYETVPAGGNGGGDFRKQTDRVSAILVFFGAFDNGFVNGMKITHLDGNSRTVTSDIGKLEGTSQVVTIPFRASITSVVISLSTDSKYVSSIQFKFSNGTLTPVFGKLGIGSSSLIIPEGYDFVGFYGKAGEWIDKIGLLGRPKYKAHTNWVDIIGFLHNNSFKRYGAGTGWTLQIQADFISPTTNDDSETGEVSSTTIPINFYTAHLGSYLSSYWRNSLEGEFDAINGRFLGASNIVLLSNKIQTNKQPFSIDGSDIVSDFKIDFVRNYVEFNMLGGTVRVNDLKKQGKVFYGFTTIGTMVILNIRKAKYKIP